MTRSTKPEFHRLVEDAIADDSDLEGQFSPMLEYATLPEAFAAHEDPAALAFLYAYYIVQDRDPDAELAISMSASHSLYYAKDFIGERFPECEDVVLADPKWGADYRFLFIDDSAPKVADRLKRDCFLTTGVATTSDPNKTIVMRL
jgi:hypothetical protein